MKQDSKLCNKSFFALNPLKLHFLLEQFYKNMKTEIPTKTTYEQIATDIIASVIFFFRISIMQYHKWNTENCHVQVPVLKVNKIFSPVNIQFFLSNFCNNYSYLKICLHAIQLPTCAKSQTHCIKSNLENTYAPSETNNGDFKRTKIRTK